MTQNSSQHHGTELSVNQKLDQLKRQGMQMDSHQSRQHSLMRGQLSLLKEQQLLLKHHQLQQELHQMQLQRFTSAEIPNENEPVTHFSTNNSPLTTVSLTPMSNLASPTAMPDYTDKNDEVDNVDISESRDSVSDDDTVIPWPKNRDGSNILIVNILKRHVVYAIKSKLIQDDIIDPITEIAGPFATKQKHADYIYRLIHNVTVSVCSQTTTQHPLTKFTDLGTDITTRLEETLERKINRKYKIQIDKAEDHWIARFFIYYRITNSRRRNLQKV